MLRQKQRNMSEKYPSLKELPNFFGTVSGDHSEEIERRGKEKEEKKNEKKNISGPNKG